MSRSPSPVPGTLRSDLPRPAAFTTTRWSLVLAARDLEDTRSHDALAGLIEAYWYPLYAFARRQGLNANDAADAVQGFFTRLLERRGLRGLREGRARFRSYLLGAFKHYLAGERERAGAARRGGGRAPISLDSAQAESRYGLELADERTPERLFVAVKGENGVGVRSLKADRRQRHIALDSSGTAFLDQAAFSPDCSMLAAFRDEAGQGSVALWNLHSGREISLLRDQHHPLWSPDGRWLLTLGDSETSPSSNRRISSSFHGISVGTSSANVWEVFPATATYRAPRSIVSISFDPGGHEVAAGGVVWTLVKGVTRHSLHPISSVRPGEMAVFDPLGRLWAVDYPTQQDELEAGVPVALRRLRPDPAPVGLVPADYPGVRSQDGRTLAPIGRSLAFAPDGRTVLVLADIKWLGEPGSLASLGETAIELWSLESGRRLSLWNQGDYRRSGFGSSAVAFSPDGSVAVVGQRLYDPETGQAIRKLERRQSLSHTVFSADGRRLYANLSGQHIGVFDLTRGRRLLRWGPDQGVLSGLALSSDGKILASAGESHDLALWDAATGEVLVRWAAHDTEITALAFQPGGRLLISGDADGTLKLWELNRLREGLAGLGLDW